MDRSARPRHGYSSNRCAADRRSGSRGADERRLPCGGAFMAAGGSMAIEDAAVLSRTITEFAEIDSLRELRRYSNSARRRRPAHLYRQHLVAWPDRDRLVLRLGPLSHRARRRIR